MKRIVMLAAISLLVMGSFVSIAQAACTTINAIPTTISSAGNYCLAKTWLVNIPSGNAITITTDNVVIDFSGFQVINTASNNTATGIFAGQTSNTSVRNGRLSGFYSGIRLLDALGSASGNVVESMYVGDSCQGAIQVLGKGALIRNNVVIGNESELISCWGIEGAGESYRIINNDVYDASRPAIHGGGGAINSVVDNNRVSTKMNAGYWERRGIQLDGTGNAMVTNNVATNMDVGFRFAVPGKYRNNLTNGCTTPYIVLDPAMIDAGNNN